MTTTPVKESMLMNRQLLKIILTLICALSLGDSVAIGATPVAPDVSPEARALLNFVHAMYGKKTCPETGTYESNRTNPTHAY